MESIVNDKKDDQVLDNSSDRNDDVFSNVIGEDNVDIYTYAPRYYIPRTERKRSRFKFVFIFKNAFRKLFRKKRSKPIVLSDDSYVISRAKLIKRDIENLEKLKYTYLMCRNLNSFRAEEIKSLISTCESDLDLSKSLMESIINNIMRSDKPDAAKQSLLDQIFSIVGEDFMNVKFNQGHDYPKHFSEKQREVYLEMLREDLEQYPVPSRARHLKR